MDEPVVILPDGAVDAVVAQLQKLRAINGRVPTSLVRRMAAALDMGESTLWRHITHGPPSRQRGRRAYVLTDRDKLLYAEWTGSIAAVHRAKEEAGEDTPGVRTLQRAFDDQLSHGERAYLTMGADARRNFEAHIRHEVPYRNHTWQGDHFEMPVLVIPPRYKHAVKAWLTVFLDCYSRAIVGWVISLRPSTAEVLAAMRAGIMVRPGRGPFGGVPEVFRWDRGLDWVSKAITEVSVALGALASPADSYHPHQKGKVERVFRTATQELLCGMPFFTEGPVRLDGELYGAGGRAMTLERLVAEVETWVNDYNLRRPHSSLDGRTPEQQWNEDPTPVRVPPQEDLRWMLLPSERRKVHKDGIHWDRVRFFATELNRLVGETVEVRYIPHDHRGIDVYVDGEFLVTAKPHHALTQDERDQHYANRREDRKEANRIRQRLSRQQRARMAPITGADSPVEDVTALDRERAGRSAGRRSDASLAKQAELTLLNLAPRNRPVRAESDDERRAA